MAQIESLPQHEMTKDLSHTIKTVVDVLGNPNISESEQEEYMRMIRGIARWRHESPKIAATCRVRTCINIIYLRVGDMWCHFGINRKGEVVWGNAIADADSEDATAFVQRKRKLELEYERQRVQHA